MPTPIVPAPITAAVVTGRGRAVSGRSGMIRVPRSAKNTCTAARLSTVVFAPLTSLSSWSRPSPNGRRKGAYCLDRRQRGHAIGIVLFGLRDEAIEDLLRAGSRIDGMRTENELERLIRADEARQSLRTPGTRDDPKRHLRQAEARARRRNPIVTGERDFQAAAEDRPMHRGDHRHRERLETSKQRAIFRFL